MDIDKQIRKDASNILLKVILFILYYIALILLGVVLIAAAGLFTYLTKDVALTIVGSLGRLGALVFIPYAAIWIFCIRMGWYLIKPLFVFPKNKDPNRVEVKPNECEELFSLIKEVADETGNKMPKHVYLTADVNSSVFYNSYSIWSLLLPTRKNLNVGIGLLYGLNNMELKSILAHEFGHFSQKTMKVGALTYRLLLITRTMIKYSEERLYDDALARQTKDYSWLWHMESKPIEYLTNKTIQKYKSIEKRNRSLSRYMEFEADNIACSLVGSNVHISALCKINELERRYDEFESIIALYLKNGFYLEEYRKGLIHFQNLIQKDALYSINYKQLAENQVGDDEIFKSRIKVIDTWNTHPSLQERIINARNQNRKMKSLDVKDAMTLIDEKTYNKVGAMRQKNIIAVSASPYLQLNPINLEDFKAELEKYISNNRVPDYLSPFIKRRFVSFELPDESSLDNMVFPSPYTDENRWFFLELARAEQDMTLLNNILHASDKIVFTYNGEIAENLSGTETLHKLYLNNCWEKLKSIDIEIFKDLYADCKDKKHLYTTYYFLLYCSDSLNKLNDLHDENQRLISQIHYYGYNSDEIDIDSDALRVQIKEFVANFDYERFVSSFGGMKYKDISVREELNDWYDFATGKSGPRGGITSFINDVWDFICSVFNMMYDEWKHRVICSYKQIPFEKS